MERTLSENSLEWMYVQTAASNLVFLGVMGTYVVVKYLTRVKEGFKTAHLVDRSTTTPEYALTV